MIDNIITLTKENIISEHICCAISDKKCAEGYLAKKNWLNMRLKDGYVFKKLDARGKVFIQYGPAERAWAPIIALNYTFIDCFWVSGQFSGKGYGKQLFDECLLDSQARDGIAVITGDKKRPFLSDPKFFAKLGFEKCDSAPPYFELWSLKLNDSAESPRFKDCVSDSLANSDNKLTVFYSDACPFTDYYVNTELKNCALNFGLELEIVHIDTPQKAQNHVSPFTIFSLYYKGKFITHEILSAKKFEKIMKERVS